MEHAALLSLIPSLMQKNNLLIVVVIYKENYYSCNTYRTLLTSKPHQAILIYDNSPVAMHSPEEFAHMNIHYISNPSNPGVSAAYNQAAKYAQDKLYKWLLICDQDTLFDNKLLEVWQKSIEQNPEIKLFVPAISIGNSIYISPTRIKKIWGHKPETSKRVGTIPSKQFTAINSGMFINLEAFLSVGGYNQRVFLDYSDHEFIRRFGEKFDSLYAMDIECVQQFSNLVQSSPEKLARYELFCQSIKGCEKIGFLANLQYLCIVVKRMLSLVVTTRSIKPIKIFIKFYL